MENRENCSYERSSPDLLPPEIISNILSRLPLDSVLRCKSVYKTWYNSARDPQFVDLQLNQSNP